MNCIEYQPSIQLEISCFLLIARDHYFYFFSLFSFLFCSLLFSSPLPLFSPFLPSYPLLFPLLLSSPLPSSPLLSLPSPSLLSTPLLSFPLPSPSLPSTPLLSEWTRALQMQIRLVFRTSRFNKRLVTHVLRTNSNNERRRRH